MMMDMIRMGKGANPSAVALVTALPDSLQNELSFTVQKYAWIQHELFDAT